MLFKISSVLFLVVTTLNAHALVPGEHLYRWQVANFTDSVKRVSNQDGYDETDFYYPVLMNATIDGNNTAVYTAAPLFPLIVFLQESMVDKSFYSHFARILSSHGYIVAIPNHLQSILPNNTTFGLWPSQRTPSAVLVDVALRSQNASSPLFGIVDTTSVGLCGHSKGGAAALFASSSRCQRPFCRGVMYKRPDAFRATVAVSTHLIPQGEPSPIKVDNGIPVALVHGDLDSMDKVCESWPLVQEQKDLIVLEGANHWAITNIQDPPGGSPDLNPQTVSQEWSIQMCAKWTTIIFDAYLKHNASELSSSTLLSMAGNINNGVMINAHCQEEDPSDDSLNKEDIAAIAIGVSFFVLAFVGLGMYYFYYYKQPLSPSGHQTANSTHGNKETPDPSYTELQKHEEDVPDTLESTEQNTVYSKQMSA